jgi:ABC-type transport system involved in multi-copper enzyme maturation permease subunit
MLGTIIKKEFLANLTSLRFILTLLLVISVFMAGGIIFIGKHQDELNDYNSIKNKNLADLQERAQALNRVPYYVQTLKKKPLAAQLWAEGYEKSLPSDFRLDIFTIRYPEIESRTNFLFPRFADIDWTFIIAFLLSFVAILMTFDSLSSEKQRGTLSLILSNSVPRDKVILGKYASGMITLAVPLFAGLVLNMIIVLLGGVSFKGEAAKILMFMLLSLFYLSIFVLLGTLISSLSSRSTSSIVALLFICVIAVILIPSFGRIGAERLFKMPSREEVDRQIYDAQKDIFANSEKFGKNARNWGSGTNVNPPARSALFNAIVDVRNQIFEDYVNKMIAQVRTGRTITRVSPTALYQYASEAVSGTGVNRFQSLYQQLKRYKDELKTFLIAKDKEDPQSPHFLTPWEGHARLISSKPLDFNGIPKFEEREMDMALALKKAVWDIAILVGMNLLLFIGNYVAFRRADVRPQ